MHIVLFKPRWIAGHALVVAVAVAFVALGFWQFGRHQDERRARDRAARAFGEPAPAFADDMPSGSRVEVTGTFDPTAEVLLRNRVRDGESGYDVLTVLVDAAGRAVLVDRGFVDASVVDNGRREIEPPRGPVVVRGLSREPRTLRPDETVDERAGLLTLPRVDLDRVGIETGYDLAARWVEAQYLDPAPASGQPALPEAADTSDVNHLSYAIQWWSLAAVPVVGWPFVLRRAVRRSASTERRTARREAAL